MLLLLNVRALRDLLRKFGWGGLHAASAVGDSSTALSPIIGYDKASKSLISQMMKAGRKPRSSPAKS
jgi:hypothetical protein